MRTGVRLWVRAELRRRRRALLLLSVLCAAVVTVVLTAVAGARRTASANERLHREVNGSHVDVFLFAGFRGRSDIDLGNGKTAEDVIAELRRLPMVEALERIVALQFAPEGMNFSTTASLTGYAVNRPRIVAGRLPEGLSEIALNGSAAEILGKAIGDEVPMQGFSQDQAERLMLHGDASVLQEEPGGPRLALRVAGVVETLGDIASVDLSGPYGIVSADFYRRYGPELGQFGPGATIRLRNGFGDLPAFREAVGRIVGESDIVSIEDKRTDLDAVNDGLNMQALALYLFAGVAAAAGLVSLGTALTRQVAVSAADGPVLSAMGLTRRQRAVAIALVASPVIVAGVVVGFAGAIAASPVLPIGLGGRAEPDPGLAFDAVALPVGAMVLAAVLAAVVAAGAWRASRSAPGRRTAADGRTTPSMVGRMISKAGIGPLGATGLRLAFETGSRTRPLPTRSALTAAVFAAAGVAAVLVFGASLSHLVDRPQLAGFPWDAAAGGGETVEDASATVGAVVADPDVESVTVGQLSEVVLGEQRTQLIGTRAAKGNRGLTLLRGRAPAGPDEAALGPQTLERLGLDLNDTVELPTDDGGSRRYRVVGTADFPILNYTDYDNGVWLTLDGFGGLQTVGGNSVILVRLAPTPNRAEKEQALQELGFDFENTGVPAKVANLDETEGFPQALAAFLAIVGLVTVGHALLSSPRRRGRELAVLRTLGFVRRQVGVTLAVQATAVTVVGLLVGLPVGVALGRTVWNLVAAGLSVVREPIVPLSVLLVVPVALAIANVMALLPARHAARARPAEVLRAE